MILLLYIIIVERRNDAMPRKKSAINVVLHLPDNPEDIKKIQDIFDRTYCRCIANRLENSFLTADEKKYILKRIAENFKKNNSLPD